jgi:dihydroorotate dehydrogenase
MSGLWEKVLRRAMFSLDAERAHEIGISALSSGLVGPLSPGFAHEQLRIECLGLKFANPLGIAAGFDKNGVAVNQLASLGFGFVEVGTVTLEPQKGNPKPRMFRLPEDQALINRLGFNNEGASAVAKRLARLKRNCIVGVNIGKNKDVPNEQAVENYLAAFDAVYALADYIAVNISSPNTPNLRELQGADNLELLLGALQARNKERGSKPLLVKIAPDITTADVDRIVRTCLQLDIAGIIATNTTISRDGLRTPAVNEIGAGGLSGKPLAERSTDVIRQIYRLGGVKLPIIGVGGIFTAEDAFEKIAAGASLVQAYTGFVYGGPGFAAAINKGLVRLMEKHGFARIADAIGSSNRPSVLSGQSRS